MTATAHALVGGAIAASIQNPALGIVFATASHPLLDMIPHWDFGRGWRNKSKQLFFAEGVFDVALGLALSYILFGRGVNPLYFFTVIFASLFFDLAQLPYWFLGWKFPPFSWVYKIQSKMQGRAALPWGIVTQVVIVVFVILLLKP